MFLLILDKNPHNAAELVPDRLKFKQLLELCQLICSAGISDVFKPIKQGKELQEWVKNNLYFTYRFYEHLQVWVYQNINLKHETIMKISEMKCDLFHYLVKNSIGQKDDIQTAIFRYVKEYAEFTEYKTNSELPIDVAVNEYIKYAEWKEKKYYENKTNRH